MSSLNIRGLGNETKRRKFFRYLKDLDRDILFLQETHCTPEAEQIWSNEWGRKIWFAHGSSSARGVAVLLKRNYPVEVDSCVALFDGRVIMLTLIVDSVKYLLVNVYGPNEDDADFYIQLFDHIEKEDNPNFIVVGDLNVTLDYFKDTRGLKNDYHLRKRNVIKNYMELQNMADVWRDRNPDKYQFSWRKNADKKQTSRLDYFLISEGLIPRVNKTEINPGFDSDHSRIDLDIALARFSRGKGTWKFNSGLLRDKDFIQEMNIILDQHNWNVKSNISPAQQWEYLKLEISNFSTEFAIKKAKGRRNLITLLETKLKNLDERLQKESSIEAQNFLKRNIQRTDEFLQDEYEAKAISAKFRSKCRWYNEAERSSRYFFQLERSNYNAKTIHKLQLENGTILEDPKSILKEEFHFYRKLFKDDNKKTRPFNYVNNTRAKLSETQAQELEQEITIEEMGKAGKQQISRNRWT